MNVHISINLTSYIRVEFTKLRKGEGGGQICE